MDDKLLLKNKLKVARAENDLSQGDLADLVGTSRQTISSIERKNLNPNIKLVLQICKVLDKKVEDVFFLVEV